jgi:hypothetical protein
MEIRGKDVGKKRRNRIAFIFLQGIIHPFGCAEDEIYFALKNPNTPKELINSLLELRGTIHPQSQLGYAAMAILRNDLPLAHRIMGVEEGEKEERKRKKQK